MKNKRILSLVLAFAMLLGTFSFAFADEAVTELTDNEKVNWLIKEGLVKGDAGGYRLEDPIKRSEVAAMVVRAIGKEELADSVKGIKTFSDVLNNYSQSWANGHINVAAAEGIVNGYPDGTFRPGNDITKAEVVSMMVRVMGGLTEEELKLAVGPNWATIYLVKAKEMGILDGVELGNSNEKAKREFVFELVYNTITTKEIGDYAIVKGLVIENDRVETLKKGEVTVEVIRELQKAKYADASRVEKGDQITLKVPADLKNGDVEYLLGKVADFTIDKDRNVVKVSVDDSYDYLTGEVVATEKSVQLNWGKKYTVVIDERYKERDDRVFRTYFNNKDYKYEDFYKDPSTIREKDEDRKDSYYAEFAKITVKDGKVLFIDAFNFDDIAPVKEVRKDGKEVVIYDDLRDGATKKIALDADTFVIEVNAETKEIKRADLDTIDADDVVHYMANRDYAHTVFVRTDAEVTGVYEKASSARIEDVVATNLHVDDEKYTALTAAKGRKAVYTYDLEEYATLEGSQTLIDKRLDAYKDEEVVLLLDMNNNVQYIAAEVRDPHFLGLIDNILGTEIRIVREDNEKETYVARMASTLISYTKDNMLKEARLQDFEIGDLVRVQINEDDEVVRLVKLADKSIKSDDWSKKYDGLNDRKEAGQKVTKVDTLEYSDTKGSVTIDDVDAYVVKDTVVFINTKDEIKATTMADVAKNYVLTEDKTPVAKAYMIYDESGSKKVEKVANIIVFTDLEPVAAKTETIVRQVVEHIYSGGTNYLVLRDTEGETKEHTVLKGVSVSKLVKDDIVEFTVTKNDAQVILGVKEILIDAENDNVYRVERKRDRELVLKDRDDNKEDGFWISLKAHQFGAIDETVNVQVKYDSDKLISVIVATDARLRGTFEPVDEEVATDGTVTYINETRIFIDGERYAMDEDTVLYDTDGKTILLVGGKEIANDAKKKLVPNDIVKVLEVKNGVIVEMKLVERAAEKEAVEEAVNNLVEEAASDRFEYKDSYKDTAWKTVTDNAEALELDVDIKELGNGRYQAAALDLLDNIKKEGYSTAEEIQKLWVEIVSSRTKTQESVEMFSKGSKEKPLEDIEFIEMLITEFESKDLQKHHSNKTIAARLEELTTIRDNFKGLDEIEQEAVLKYMAYDKTTSSTATRNAIKNAISNKDTHVSTLEADALQAVNGATSSVMMRKALQAKVLKLDIPADQLEDVAAHVFEVRPEDGYENLEALKAAIAQVLE